MRRKGTLLALTLALAGCGPSGTPAQSASTLVTQGLQAQLSGDLTTASSDYNQAVQLDPANKFALYDLGTIDDQQGNRTQALQEYQKALTIDPNFADALFNTAVDTATSNPARAEQLYRQVVAIQPTWAAAWPNLGFVLQGEGRVAEAKADWSKAIALDPTLASRIPSPSAAAASPSPSPSPSPSR